MRPHVNNNGEKCLTKFNKIVMSREKIYVKNYLLLLRNCCIVHYVYHIEDISYLIFTSIKL